MAVDAKDSGQRDSAGLAKVIADHLGAFRREVSGAPGETSDSADALFAAQIVSQIQAYVLATTAIRSVAEIQKLVRPGSAKFKTNLSLEDIARMLAEAGAVHKGHFELLSGFHSQHFLIFSKLGSIVDNRRRLGLEIAARMKASGILVDCVIAPVTAGAVLVHDVAAETDAEMAFFEVNAQSRPSGIRLGYSVANKKVAIVNDMTTTGEGIRAMVEIVRRNGGQVVAMYLFATRGEIGLQAMNQLNGLNIRAESLVHLDFTLSKAGSGCESCEQSLPLIASKLINR